MTTILEERQKNRWLMLHKVYELTGGLSEKYIINMYAVGEQLGWTREKTEAAFDYLRGEGLLKIMTFGGGITLTHQGVREIEEAKESPEKPTLHFPPHITNNIYGDSVMGDKVVSGDNVGTLINNSPTDYRTVVSNNFGTQINSNQIINNHADLVRTSQDIKALLNQLLDDFPDDSHRVLGAKAIDTIDLNPELKSRIIEGFKAGSFAALEKMIDHPVAKFFIAGAKEAFK
jgi:hypothetical protein